MLQSQNSFCTRQGDNKRSHKIKTHAASRLHTKLYWKMAPKGIAISIDALLAMILTIAFIGFIGLGLQQETETTDIKATTNLSQATDDAFTALDKSGFLASQLVDRYSEPITAGQRTNIANAIDTNAKKMLPRNIGMKVKISEYAPPVPLDPCRDAIKTNDPDAFDICFPEAARHSSESDDEEIPADKEITHGRKIQILRQSIAAAGPTGECEVVNLNLEEKSKEKQTAFLEELPSIDRLLLTEVVVDPSNYPSNYIACHESPAPLANREPTVTAKMRDLARQPVAIMLAMDESGSMGTYDMSQKTTNGSFDTGKCGTEPGADCEGTSGNCPLPRQPGVNPQPGEPQHTGWARVDPATASFDPDAILLRIPDDPATGYPYTDWAVEYSFSDSENTKYTCGNNPKVRALAPNGTLVYSESAYNSSDPYYYPGSSVKLNRGTMLSNPPNLNNPAITNWEFWTWSAKSYPSISLNGGLFIRVGVLGINPFTPAAGEGKTLGGSSGECNPDLSTAKLFATKTIPTLKYPADQTITMLSMTLVWDPGSYDPGISDCWPRLFFKKQGSTDPLPVPATKCTSSSCYYTVGNPNPAADDKYEIYVWTDDSIKLNSSTFYIYIRDPVGWSKSWSLNVPVGTCSGVACDIDPTNCDLKTDSTWVHDLSTFTVNATDDHFLGIKAGLSNLNYGGECTKANNVLDWDTGPAFRVRKPPSGTLSYPPSDDNCADGMCTVTVTGSPVAGGTYELEGWADKQNMNFTADWNLQRVDVAKKSAKAFIDNLATYSGMSWTESDLIGAVAYSNMVGPGDARPLTNERNDVKAFLNGLSPSGQTAMADAIARAAAELQSETGKVKIMILLTDGKANICLGGTPCTASGSPPSVENTAIEQAIQQAISARASGITVYVIGFADQGALQSGVYEEKLKELAKNKLDDGESGTDYCARGDLGGAPGENCGKYYWAKGGGDLTAIFTKIIGDLKDLVGVVDEIVFPFPAGMEIVDTDISGEAGTQIGEFGIWDDTTDDWLSSPVSLPGGVWPEGLTWPDGERRNPKYLTTDCLVTDASGGKTLKLSDETCSGKQKLSYTGNLWFATQFKIKLPCNGPYCKYDYVLLPPKNPEAAEESLANPHVTDESGTIIYPWREPTTTNNCTILPCTDNYLQVPFYYIDLGIKFDGGRISGSDSLLDLTIENRGHYDISLPPNVITKFLVNEETPPLTVNCTGSNCGLTPVNGSVTGDEIAKVSAGTLTLQNMTLCRSQLDAGPCSTAIDQATGVQITDVPVNSTGSIYARLNPEGAILECSENNRAQIRCQTAPQLKFYTIDYYVWVK